MVRCRFLLLLLGQLFSGAALGDPAPSQDALVYSNETVKIVGRAYSAHAYEIHRDAIKARLEAEPAIWKKQSPVLETLPDSFILFRNDGGSWIAALDVSIGNKRLCSDYPGKRLSAAYNDVINGLQEGGIKLKEFGGGAPLNWSNEEGDTKAINGLKNLGFLVGSQNWTKTKEIGNWNTFLTDLYPNCQEVPIAEMAKTLQAAASTTKSPTSTPPPAPINPQEQPLADPQARVETLIKEKEALYEQLQGAKTAKASSDARANKANGDLAKAREQLQKLEQELQNRGSPTGPLALWVYIMLALLLLLLLETLVLVFLPILIARRIRSGTHAVLGQIDDRYRSLVDRIETVRSVVVRPDPRISVTRGSQNQQGPLIELLLAAREAAAKLVEQRTLLEGIRVDAPVSNEMLISDRSDIPVWSDGSVASEAAIPATKTISDILNSLDRIRKEYIDLALPTERDYSVAIQCTRDTLGALPKLSNFAIDLGRQLSASFDAVNSQVVRLEEELRKQRKSYAKAKDRSKSYEDYLLRDLKAAGYLDADLTADDRDLHTRLMAAAKAAADLADKRPELHGYVRSLISLREFLRGFADAAPTYFKAAGLSDLLDTLAEEGSFLSLYKSATPSQALEGQWLEILQKLYRAALLLDTYWKEDVDPELRHRLAQTKAVAEGVIRMYRIFPHSLHLPVERSWMEGRRSWVEETRGQSFRRELAESTVFRDQVLPIARERPIYCDIATWGYNSDEQGTVAEKSRLVVLEPGSSAL